MGCGTNRAGGRDWHSRHGDGQYRRPRNLDPFPTTQIVDWVDQAILWLAAGAEPCLSHVKILRAMGLRGASDLVDATQDPAGKLRVVLAAQTLRGTIVEDPIPPAQLAGMRAQLKVEAAQQKVSRFRGKTRMKTLPALQMRSKPCAWLNGW